MEQDIANLIVRLEAVHAVIVEANQVSARLQEALSMPYAIKGLNFRGSLNDINAALVKARDIQRQLER